MLLHLHIKNIQGYYVINTAKINMITFSLEHKEADTQLVL